MPTPSSDLAPRIRVATLCALLSLSWLNESAVNADEPEETKPTTADLFVQAQEAASREDYQTARKLLDRVVERKDAPKAAYYWRGRALFCLAKVKESVADFDRYVKANESAESRQWERGIAMYYAGEFQRGADQFKLYQTYHANDVENSVWRFLCLARAKDVETARKNLLPIRNDPRIPMMKIYDLYRGAAEPDEVLEAAEEGNDANRIAGQRFYAELYVGLYYEATGNPKAALPLLKSAAESHRKTQNVNRYMWAVADVHYRLLKAKKPDAKKPDADSPNKKSTNPNPNPKMSWKRHTIDNASRGADGVRLGDVNGDGRLDIVTGWEEGGRIRVCAHPGDNVRAAWPAIEVGQVKSPEDAVFVDLDGDGHLDVVSCCEGKTKTIYVHWAPEKWNDAQWTTDSFPATRSKQAWMFALPMDIDDQHATDLIVGAKGSAAEVGWLQSPAQPRATADWKYHSLYKAGWIMSLLAVDMDNDGDQDVLLSDRKGANRGVKWLENPGAVAVTKTKWNEHLVGGESDEVMFLTTTQLEPNGPLDIVCATRNQRILIFRKNKKGAWQTHAIPNPYDTPHGKSIACGDIDGDGDIDMVHACNNGGNRKFPGVVWIERQDTKSALDASAWTTHNLSGNEGVKFDIVELVDIDEDGDLDVITCEERDNLGVFWYENQLVSPSSARRP
jgi:tetratricopeptide (TPR) repeat protein